jgi:hypothetical protein
VIIVKLLPLAALKGTSLTSAALFGTGLTVLALSLGGIAGLSDDVRAASEAHHAPPVPTVTWEEQLDDPAPTTPEAPAPGTYGQDGELTVRGY